MNPPPDEVAEGWSLGASQAEGMKNRLSGWILGQDYPIVAVKEDVTYLIQSWLAFKLLAELYESEARRFEPILQGVRELRSSTEDLTRRVEEIIKEARRGHGG